MDLLKLPHSSYARMEGGEACPLFVLLPCTSRCRRVAFQPPRCRHPQPSPLPCGAPLENILSPLTGSIVTLINWLTSWMITMTANLLLTWNNAGTIITISKDRVKSSPQPNSWKLRKIFATGIVLGSYLALITVVFFWLIKDIDFFSEKFGRSLRHSLAEMMAAFYL
ncbi:hypothetical protein HN51_032067 [Arachis hypogaea]